MMNDTAAVYVIYLIIGVTVELYGFGRLGDPLNMKAVGSIFIKRKNKFPDVQID